jgi:hypothetical protein
MDGYIIERNKPAEQLVEIICKKRGLQRSLVENMLSYNIITIQQLAKITGYTTSLLYGKTMPVKRTETKLRAVYPFPFDQGKNGPVFIAMDRGCVDLMMEALAL